MFKQKIFILTLCLISFSFLKAKNVITVTTIDTALELTEAVDYHVESSENFGTGSVDLTHPDAWLFLDNIRPRTFLENYASKVKINGQPLDIQIDTIYLSSNSSIEYTLSHQINNARVNVYRHGTVIIPHNTTSYKALTVYTGENFEGNSLDLISNKRNYDLEEYDNEIASFKLKRGYMATMAVESDGKGFSRVFIADTADVEIPELPKELAKKISFIAVFDWQWPSKKGWCSSGRNAYNEIDITESTWWYSWSADRPVLANQEYVPIKQNGGWPSNSQILNCQNVTHLLGFNEPDRPDQANATVESAINGWEDLMATGLRLGTPAIADNFNWLYNFMEECEKRNFRVDFVAIHAYWGGAGGAYNVLTDGKVDINKWYNRLKEVHERCGKRPLWITEWNNGANWTNDGEPYWDSDPVQQQLQNKEILDQVLHMMDTCSFIERYSIYNWVSDRKAIVEGEISQAQVDNGQASSSELGKYTSDGWANQRLTPAGIIYRDRQPSLAFRPENEVIHRFNPVSPILEAACDRSGTLRIQMADYNGNMTDSFIFERKIDEGEFEEILSGIIVPEVYNDSIASKLNKTSKISYRLNVVVDGQTVVSNIPSLTVGAVGGGDVIRPAVASFNSVLNQFFYMQEPYEQSPVAVSGGLSYTNNVKMMVPALSSIGTKFFNYRIKGWQYSPLTSMSGAETAACLVAQEGIMQWGSLKAEGGTVTNVNTNWQTVNFTQSFDEIPVVFADMTMNTNDYPVMPRVRNVTKTGFEIHMTGERSVQSNLLKGTVKWLAIEQGSTNAGGRKVQVGTVGEVGEINERKDINSGGFEEPVFVSALQTSNDGNTYGVRYIYSDNTFSVFKQLEKSRSAQNETVAHDVIGYVLVEEFPTSVPQIKSGQNTLQFYPTLVEDVLFVAGDINKVEVVNMNGVVILKSTLSAGTLNVSDLKQGMYFLRTENGQTGRFIKK